ncbi:MAG: DUF4231 domain-containing protein [Anaerolineae bacterium]|nr:DUF4231 domain-containing protein [Anaerolineae bacterium]
MADKPQFKFMELFFLARRPKLGGMPEEWIEPSQPEQFDAQIVRSDFVIESELAGFNLAGSAIVKQDLQDLRIYLLKAYFRSNTRAKFQQNRYFLQQWILVLGTFLTALVAALTFTVNPGAPAAAVRDAAGAAAEVTAVPGAEDIPPPAQEEVVPNLPTTTQARISGIITAIATFVTTIVSSRAQGDQAQYNWYLQRTVTEELRRHYFLFLAHLPPYHTENYAEVLESNVVQIERQLDQRGGSTEATEAPPRNPHTEDELQALVDLYRAKRVQVQTVFYDARIKENAYNADFVSTVGVILVAGATLLSTLNIVLGAPVLILFIALLPVFAALLVSFEKIYGWGRQITLYKNALDRLSVDNTIPPAIGRRPRTTYLQVFIDYVTAVENTLQNEVSQWGQAVLKDGSNVSSLSAKETLDLALAKSNLPPDQIEIVRQMFEQQP